ncbi:glycosyltransferase [Hephaestia mangrovi]|uniref:glycosyltransferase n=1 Tax=Hephaestia mangrovi TaxID=2873268 RepID=UPI001CA70FAD|nr:glycosyltransferase [Hephaestia mangrovi]MBY8828182.1 glycosyltransferase [Hephaestia mangrovi]
MAPPARHILTFAQTLDGGGVERVQLRLAAAWIEAGRRVTLLLGCGEGPLAAELPRGIEVVALRSASYGALYAASRHIRRLAPDVIFCAGNHYTSVAAWTRLRLGTTCPPIVAKASNALTRHDQGAIFAAAYRAWLRLHPRFVDHLVAMSPALADEAIAAMRLPRDRVSVIANPPALHAPDPAPPALPDARFVLGIGRLEPQKRWDRLIDAFARIEDDAVHLVILGDGAMRDALSRRIAALGVADRVHLPGHALDPRPALARAAVVALTSDYEGVPGVLREALAQGTPVIATDASAAVTEIVAAPAVGTVVARNDAIGLVAALDHWLAPGRPRPAPIPEPGSNAAADYLALFDRIVAARVKA